MSEFKRFEDFADALWLTIQIVKAEGFDLSKYKPKQEKQSRETPVPSGPPKPHSEPIPTPGRSGMGIGIQEDSKSDNDNVKDTNLPTVIGTGTVVPFPKEKLSSLDIQRSLRRLKQKVTSFVIPPQVNIDGTLYQVAKNRIAIHQAKKLNQKRISIKSDLPVLKRSQERWIDLVLIIDVSSPTMRFFEGRREFLNRTIEESGIFRNIHVYYMHESREVTPVISKSKESLDFNVDVTKEMLGSSHRSVFWVVSDCISPVWDSWYKENGIGDFFNNIGKQNPIAIIQMLPESLWLRSGISYFEMCKAWANLPLMPNRDLQLSVPKDSNGLGIPIMPIHQTRFSAWADMIFGHSNQPVLSIFIPEKQQMSKRYSDQLYDEENRLNLFLNTAPLQTKQLAAYLSVVPSLSFDALRKLKEYMIPTAPIDTVADLVTSSVITITDGDRKKVEYSDNSSKMRREFMEMTPYSKSLETMANYYYYIADPTQRFRDKDDNEIDFWFYIDNWPNVDMIKNLNENGVNDMNSVFSQVLQLHQPPDTNHVSVSPSIDILLRRNENPPNGHEVKDHDFSYLDIPHLDISMWGDTGSGKTSMILSLAKSFSIEKNKYEMRYLDHYGNKRVAQHRFSKPDNVPQTEYLKDYLYYLKGRSLASKELSVCFHDFPGKATLDLPSPVQVSYNHSNAIILCFSGDEILDSTKLNKQNTNQKLETFFYWASNQRKTPKLCVCLTKSDTETNFENNPSVQAFKDKISTTMRSVFQDKDIKIFIVSSWGSNKDDWTPKGITEPILWIVEESFR